MDKEIHKYRMICTLTFGDIYGQIITWLIVIFLTLASAFALWSTTRQIYALAVVGMVVLLSLPFLLFAFVTTLLNHIEFAPIDETQTSRRTTSRRSGSTASEPATAS